MLLPNLTKYDIILASKSPRRRELLMELGLAFRVQAVEGLEENFPPGLSGGEIALYLANLKAEAFPDNPANGLVITADTIVYHEHNVLGKPRDSEEAKNILRSLSGNKHMVYTGVCIHTRQRRESFYSSTSVHFSTLEENEIAHYVTHYAPYDKAGSYGIQELIGYIAVARINGSFFNVMGLPIQELYQQLKTF